MSSSQSSSPFSNPFWPKFILLLVVAIGGPTAAITFFGHFIMSHPLPTIIIGLFYEMGVVLLGFLVQVGQKLQSRWVDRCVDWLDNIVQGNIPRYRKEYFQYLYYQHRDFDVKGLTTLGTYALELDQIFVELRIDPTTLKQMSSNPIPTFRTNQRSNRQAPKRKNRSQVRAAHVRLLPLNTDWNQAFPSRSYHLWDYLASKPLAGRHIVIIGPPGSGKTTLLKHTTLALVDYRKRYRHYHRVKIPHTLPIVLFLRDHIQNISEIPKFSVVDALLEHLKKWEQPEIPKNWLEKRLTKGRCLVMLDGLDEVADPESRQKVVNWVQKQMVAFNQSRFIVTSRPFGYRSNPLSGVVVLEVRPFSDEQIELFVHQWYLANEIMRKQKDDSGVRMRARAEAKDLLQRLQNTPALFALTVNPLLLTMIATVHYYSGELPGNRMALYAEICEVFLGKRQQARGQILELTPAQMQLVLEPLAYHLMLKGKRDIAVAEAQDVIKEPLARVKLGMLPEAFLQLVENASGLLLEQENGVYSFAHLTFQEYLTATHIRERQLVGTLIAHVEESWWQETIRLYCAMADATPIIATCLRDNHPSVRSLALALDYVEESRDIQPAVKARLEAIINQGIEDTDHVRQRLIAETLLIRRQRQMVYVKEGIYRDTSLITCAEYQLFLDEQQKQGRYHQPDHWNSISFPEGFGQAPILGVRRSDALAFCDWLTARNREGWHYRLPHAEEWSLEEREKKLHEETGYWVEGEPCFLWSQGTPSDNLLQQFADYINRATAHARDRASELVSALDFDRASELANNLIHPNNLPLLNVLDRTRASILARILDRFSTRAPSLDLSHDLDRALSLAHNLAHTRNHTLKFLDLYVTLFLLQERIAGRFPAYEGILLFRDRQQEK